MAVVLNNLMRTNCKCNSRSVSDEPAQFVPVSPDDVGNFRPGNGILPGFVPFENGLAGLVFAAAFLSGFQPAV
jgi:hypothetical protein